MYHIPRSSTTNHVSANGFPHHIPLDVVGEVIQVLGKQGDMEEVRKFSGLSSFCLREARRHLFETIDLTRGHQADPRRFTMLLEQHPDVAPYIRFLHLRLRQDDFNNARLQSHLYRALTSLSNIKRLTILAGGEDACWEALPKVSLRSALQHLILLPSFEDLRLQCIQDVPLGDLALAPYLRRLELNDVSLQLAPDTRVLQRAGQCWGRLETLKLHGPEVQMGCLSACIQGGPLIFNLSRLRALDVELDDHNLIRCLTDVFRFHPLPALEALKLQLDEWASCKLESSYLEMHSLRLYSGSMGSVRLTQVFDSWILPRYRTLKHLKISTQVLDHHGDPYSGFAGTLEKLRQRNVLSSLELLVVIHGGQCTAGRAWGQLTQVLTQHGWHHLRDVQLHIQIVTDNDFPSRTRSPLELALENLRHSYFAPLFTSQQFKFSFEVIGDM
ncbi:hypothetical protein BJ165DRAFT_1008303 [Panaeolus papilionaceus]|nr:hypothetical protein BJ165DRAFT_1008303 [Panaeolus papilionaceus]